MKIITPSVEILRTGLETEFCTPEQFIEKVGRTCYKSEDKITDDSAAKFVSNLIKRGHEAMIEHWNLIFKTDEDHYEQFVYNWETILHSDLLDVDDPLRPYLRFTDHMDDNGKVRCIVSGNMRTWRNYAKACVSAFGFVPRYLHGVIRCYPLFFPEYQSYVPANFINDILIPVQASDLTVSERWVHQDITIKFICDRGVSHEIVRHRVASFAQESTRYCNYGLDKFGNEITVIRPSWCEYGSDQYTIWKTSCEIEEAAYFNMLAAGCTPQQARSVLTNSTKTEVVVTMNPAGWNHFFKLRCDPAAHPDMQEVAMMARDLYNENVHFA
jgi:thymidylate synthase (FAD)